MSDIKLNDEQIEDLKDLYSDGFRYIGRCDNNLICFEGKPFRNDKTNEWFSYRRKDVFSPYENEKDYNFITSQDEKPFYFGDMFEVVYKGNK